MNPCALDKSSLSIGRVKGATGKSRLHLLCANQFWRSRDAHNDVSQSVCVHVLSNM